MNKRYRLRLNGFLAVLNVLIGSQNGTAFHSGTFSRTCSATTRPLAQPQYPARQASSAGAPIKNYRQESLLVLNMGLYDKPLPPRPPPRNEPNRNNNNGNNLDDDDDDNEDDTSMDASSSSSSVRLFEFNAKGREVNDLLPALSRRLDTGIECYFEPQDRLVQNLVDKTACHVDDACWALEACKGDITEAWTRISMARRLALNAKRFPSATSNTGTAAGIDDDDDGDDDFVDEDSFQVEMEELFAKRKQKRMADEKQRNAQDFWKSPDEPDQQWTPGKGNPRPIDDEPWFTG